MSDDITMVTEVVDGSAADVASFLHRLANRIEAADGDEVLIGLWSTGHGESWEACFQIVLDVRKETDRCLLDPKETDR